jgi:hypothetical protein
MKANVGTFETVFVALADAATLDFGKAARGLFSIKHRQVSLLEGELTSPGKEVAYIVKARETFTSST